MKYQIPVGSVRMFVSTVNKVCTIPCRPKIVMRCTADSLKGVERCRGDLFKSCGPFRRFSGTVMGSTISMCISAVPFWKSIVGSCPNPSNPFETLGLTNGDRLAFWRLVS